MHEPRAQVQEACVTEPWSYDEFTYHVKKFYLLHSPFSNSKLLIYDSLLYCQFSNDFGYKVSGDVGGAVSLRVRVWVAGDVKVCRDDLRLGRELALRNC